MKGATISGSQTNCSQ